MIKETLQEAFILKARGYYKRAIENFYIALSEDNTSVELLFEIAESYFLMNEEERALNYLEQILENNPTHISSLKLLKNVFINKKAWQEAEQTAKNIYCISQDLEDLNQILNLLNRQNKFEEVFEYNIAEEDDGILYEKAFAKFHMNNLEEALDYIDKSLEAKSDNKKIVLKGKILYRMNKREECVNLLSLFEQDYLDSESLNFIGLVKQHECKFNESIKYFLEAIKMDSSCDEYYYNCASTYFKLGDSQQAKKYYNMAISISPDNQNYHFALANLYYSEKQYKRAMEELTYDFFEAKLLKAIILYDSGYLALAKKELEKLMLEQPDNELMLEYKRRIDEELSI